MKAQLEIACFTYESALIAFRNGADRIELCDGFEVGGTTPSIEIVTRVMQHVSIPVYVMIRHRGGDFCYTEDEIITLKASLTALKQIGVHGFVFGILNENKTVNTTKCKELIELAHPLPCTFHRAFDEVLNWENALEAIISCGFSTILTSGTKPSVKEGLQILKMLNAKANGRITIMPGGGLRSSNVAEIINETGVTFVHSSAILKNTTLANAEEIQALKKQIA